MRSVAYLACFGLLAVVPAGAASAGEQTAAAPTSDAVRQAEETLKQEGYLANADGVFDAETRAAVTKFQERHALHVTGELDAETLSSLGVDDEQAQAGDAGEQQVGQPPVGPQVGRVPGR